MYYSYVEIEYVAMSFSPTRTDLALKLLRQIKHAPSHPCTFQDIETSLQMFHHAHLEPILPGTVPQIQMYSPCSTLCSLKPANVDGLLPKLQDGYVDDFSAADAAFQAGRLEVTSQSWEARWQYWCAYVWPLGVDPYLQHTPFQTCVRCLTGFAARTRTGFYGQG